MKISQKKNLPSGRELANVSPPQGDREKRDNRNEPNQTAFRPSHLPVIAGISPGGMGGGFFASMNTTMKTHWVADMYPLNESDIEPLAESIKANGQRTPIMALKDGTIIDGRNRWLACQKAGVEPIVTIINPDGEDVPEDKLWAIATDCNSMRRDMTSSLRACLAAESWKRLFPDRVGAGRPMKNNSPKMGNFEDFARDKFKVAKGYAEQALAILNYSPELLEDAKNDLAGTYKTYQARVAEDRTKRQNMKLLESPENSDIKERVANANLALDEAITLLRARHAEEVQRMQIEEDTRRVNRKHWANALAAYYHFYDQPASYSADIIKPREGESTISGPGGQTLDKNTLIEFADLLTKIANEM